MDVAVFEHIGIEMRRAPLALFCWAELAPGEYSPATSSIQLQAAISAENNEMSVTDNFHYKCSLG